MKPLAVKAAAFALTLAITQEIVSQDSSGLRVDTSGGITVYSTMQKPAVDTAKRPPAADVSMDALPLRRESMPSDSPSAGKDVQSLDKMVVSATRTRRRVSETPASVTVISRKEIECSPANDVNDLIAKKTGVQVCRYAGMGEGVPYDIIMRGIPGGFGSTRILVLVDGVPTNASGTPFLVINEIPNEIIENIEIVRGPYSCLYGANAFGGVINVVTKTGDGRPSLAGMFETSYPFNVVNAWYDDKPIRKAARTGAQQALWNGNFMSSGGNEKLHYLVNGGYRFIGNWLLDDSALVAKTDTSYLIPVRNYDYGDWRLFGKAGWRPNDRLSIALHTRYFNSNLGYGYTRYSPDTIDIDIKSDKVIFGPQVNYTVNDNFTLKAVGYVRRIRASYATEMNKQPISWESEARDGQVDLQGVLRAGAHQVITLGGEFLSNGIAFGDVVTSKNAEVETGLSERISNSGAYLQDEISFLERFHVVPGIRMDYHTAFGSAISPKLGISAAINDLVRLRSSAGRAFRAPNLTELYMQPLPLKDTITLESNPDLDPEYIWALDGGADFTPYPNVKIQAGLFFNTMENLIGPWAKLKTVNDSLRAVVSYENIGSAWSGGSELEVEWNIVRGLTLQGSYVFQKSRNESASDMAKLFRELRGGSSRDVETDIQLDYIPTHKWSVGVSFSKTFGGVRLSLSGEELVVGRRTYQNFYDIKMDIGTAAGMRNDVILNYGRNGFEIEAINPPLARLPLYAVTDFKIRCDIRERLWASLEVKNLFDAAYEERFGTFAPRRLASLKIGVEY
ncbi:MAG: TonB-dependent receptor [Chitinispirillaceae bacterium]|nr:TonB-dependent receptor [Chitinispirillaceae bacterium]